MFTSSLQEEVKALEEDIAAVKEKVEDDMICEKLRLFVYAPREIQSIYKADAGEFIFYFLLSEKDDSYDNTPNRTREVKSTHSHPPFW